MRHPPQAELALFAGGEIGAWKRFRVANHLRRCCDCEEDVRSFQETRQAVSLAASSLPENLNWDRLAEEMTANIRLGLAAAECVASSPRPERRLGWRAATAIASMTALVVTGWWLTIPAPELRRQQQPAAASSERVAVLQVSSGGIEVKRDQGALTLRHPETDAVLSVNFRGAIRARYVDSETGQVTINNVYTE